MQRRGKPMYGTRFNEIEVSNDLKDGEVLIRCPKRTTLNAEDAEDLIQHLQLMFNLPRTPYAPWRRED